jgi:inositol 1,4,5-triphosphate receptor type 3
MQDSLSSVRLVLGIIHAAVTVFCIVMWLYSRFPLRRIVELRLYEEDKIINGQRIEYTFLDYLDIYIYRLFIMNAEISPFLYHLLCVALGLAVSPQFYSFGLLAILNVSEPMRYVTQAVLKHIKQLAMVVLLALIGIFVYSNLNFYYFDQSFQTVTLKNGKTENLCDSLSRCFFTAINEGLRDSSGIGGSMFMESYSGGGTYFFLILTLKITFFLIINVIFLNIVFGIIIDTFEELRVDSAFREDHTDNFCLICNLEKWQFRKCGKSFDQHTQIDHNLWNYVYYIYKIRFKIDAKDLNGQETYIYEKLKINDLSWFPFKRSRELGNIADDLQEVNMLCRDDKVYVGEREY